MAPVKLHPVWEPALSMKRSYEAVLNGFSMRVTGAARHSGRLAKWTVGRAPLAHK